MINNRYNILLIENEIKKYYIKHFLKSYYWSTSGQVPLVGLTYVLMYFVTLIKYANCA